MPTLYIHFPGGRYHATPWGHHVNEGLIEWPPSPWRLLRALISTGFTACGWTGERPPKVACSLIEKLASVLPRYFLPQVSGAHSRHYMPLARFKNGREDTTVLHQQEKLVLALGNEASGLSEELLALADDRLRLPTVREKAESLNVAACGAILMYLASPPH